MLAASRPAPGRVATRGLDCFIDLASPCWEIAFANPGCLALLAEDEAREQVIGFALYFHAYSTFLTRWGIYLEALYVKPAFRGHGAGFGLLKRMAEIALESGYQRLDFSVLSWNRLAINLYRKLGAQDLPDRKGMRLSGQALQNLGESA